MRIPDMDVESVRELLGYSSKKAVRQLAAKGSEEGGIDAYISVKGENGKYRWIKKRGSIHENDMGHAYKEMFFSPEIEEWDKAHPTREPLDKEYYTDEDRDTVFRVIEAHNLRLPDGRVPRVKLFDILQENYNWGPGKRNRQWYRKMKSILDDENIPPEMRLAGNGKRRK